MSDPKYKKEYVIAQKKKLKTKDIFIGFPSVFAKYYEYLHPLGFSDEPDYAILKNLLKQSLYDNFGKVKVGEFEPFRSRQAKIDYLLGDLELEQSKTQYEDEASWDKSGYFVDSFTNFKSYEVDERQSEASYEKIDMVCRETGNKQNRYTGLKAIIEEVGFKHGLCV